MTISFVNAASAVTGAAANALAPAYASATIDDQLLLFVSISGLSPITDPSGWVVVDSMDQGTLQRTKVYRRKCDGSESGTVSIAWTGTAQTGSAVMVAYRGLDPTAPIGAVATDASGTSGTTHSVNASATSSYTLTGWQVCAFADANAAGLQAYVPITGFTERADVSSTVAQFMGLTVDDSNGVVATGATSALPARTSGAATRTATSWVGWNLSLNPYVSAIVEKVPADAAGPTAESYSGTRPFSAPDASVGSAAWPVSGQGWPRIKQS